MYKRKILLFIILSISIILPPLSYPQPEFETTTIKLANVELIVEIANDRITREKGLMRRDRLPEDKGMLFVYPKKRRIRLWMKNTYVPLSVAFIKEDGSIAQIVDMRKINSTKIYRAKEKVKYALEVPLGYFEKNGVKVGDYCVIPNIPSK